MFQPIDYLRFQAAMNPEAVAVQGIERGLSFHALYKRVRCIAHKLRETGIAPGDVVITTMRSPLADWLVTLALLHEAAISGSRISAEPLEVALGVRWFINDRVLPAFPTEKTIVIDKEWLSELPSGDILPHQYSSGDSVCRLVMTSGTTGHAKAVPFSIDTLRARLAAIPAYWATSKIELNLMSVSTVGGFSSALYTLVAGNPFFYYQKPEDVIELIRRFDVVNLAGSPTQLALLAKHVAATGSSLNLELVRSAGGILSDVLRDAIQRNLGRRILNVYGSTEAGGTTVIWADSRRESQSVAGMRLPHTDFQIVDDNHQRLPAGVVGVVRVRSPAMVKGYFLNDAATHESFRDGWFYPGDTGMLNAQGLLVLTGRISELINCGGIKVDPVSMDDFVQTYPGIVDGAVFGYTNAHGVQQIAAAVVVADGFDFKAFQGNLTKHFGQQTAPVKLMSMKKVPRNDMGKIQRQQLTQQLEHHEHTGRADDRSMIH